MDFTIVGFICFNSQPPEGGWGGWLYDPDTGNWFQLTAARRRLERPSEIQTAFFYRFNSQPPEGGWTPSRL